MTRTDNLIARLYMAAFRDAAGVPLPEGHWRRIELQQAWADGYTFATARLDEAAENGEVVDYHDADVFARGAVVAKELLRSRWVAAFVDPAKPDLPGTDLDLPNMWDAFLRTRD